MTTRDEAATTAIDDGSLVGANDLGALLVQHRGVEVRESTWAGAYYCAHVLWLLDKLARAPSTSIKHSASGDPLVGFLHVPADAFSTVGTGAAPLDRHEHTERIVAAALRGIVDELAPSEKPARVLLTGFGPFAAVVDNPTGAFVDDDDAVERTVRAAFGDASRTRVDGRFRVTSAAPVQVARLRFDVSDTALDGSPGSLPWAVHAWQPHAVLSLGVHRASTIYRVEIEPSNAGLVDDDDTPKHANNRAASEHAPHNRALAHAITRGARSLGF